MSVFKLSILPGTSSRPDDRESKQKCPHCGRKFKKASPRRCGDYICYCCPRCGYVLEREKQ